jgi:hypothetical protein
MPLLCAAVTAAGADVDVVAWDDDRVDWSAFDLVVVRSTWDYAWRLGEFLTWAERCSRVARLVNPVPVLRWNADKTYLSTLAASGIPVVDTRYVAPGRRADLPADQEFVVKPAVGAGARYAARYGPDDRDLARAHVTRLHGEGLTAMVQPYQHGVDIVGERALVFVAGRFLHGVRKGPVLAQGSRYDQPREAHPGTRVWLPTPEELTLAQRALAAVPDVAAVLYARVDMVGRLRSEGPLIMELELIEPNLFLATHHDSLPAVAEAIVRGATRDIPEGV